MRAISRRLALAATLFFLVFAFLTDVVNLLVGLSISSAFGIERSTMKSHKDLICRFVSCPMCYLMRSAIQHEYSPKINQEGFIFGAL